MEGVLVWWPGPSSFVHDAVIRAIGNPSLTPALWRVIRVTLMVLSDFQFIPVLPAEPDNTINAMLGKVVEMACAKGCTAKQASEGTVLIAQRSTDCPLFLLLRGIMGAVIRTGRKRMILHAFVEGDAFADVESFIGAGPSVYGIEALTATKYVELPRPLLQQMIRESPELAEWIRLQHLRIIMQLSRRIVTLAGTSPAARYQHFVHLYPDLVNRLPQYQLASILGVSAESLSRVRRRISRKKPSTPSRPVPVARE